VGQTLWYLCNGVGHRRQILEIFGLSRLPSFSDGPESIGKDREFGEHRGEPRAGQGDETGLVSGRQQHQRDFAGFDEPLWQARWGIECGLRDTKDPRFGMGLGSIRVSTPERRDRLWLLNAFAIALTMLAELPVFADTFGAI
jgi:hypothetical protein